MVQPNGQDQVVPLGRHQNSFIDAAVGQVECPQPVDGKQVKAGISMFANLIN